MSNLTFPDITSNQQILTDLAQQIQNRPTTPISVSEGENGGLVMVGSLDQPNVLAGSSKDDVITAGAQNDAIDGGDGDDFILGLQGDDSLLGGDGNDTIYGGKGNDLIFGGSGDDIIYGDEGDDTVFISTNKYKNFVFVIG
ncbi:calcium-binding protein [Planktothrix pseudagardhii]|uniref:Hemolysin-type calcium-binding protein n=1 Tax=Planktothrix pseudagardhii TaxID=132604 RepID=A0A9W4CKL1_9CYAN|nr:hypothetical protein [Planktothrix pseudagardhii]CAD5950075.1 Hemolysin-type calcium-binding protein [Planktothrix pseudagardhii]